MARSPSPTGSSYSSRRYRRDDDRDHDRRRERDRRDDRDRKDDRRRRRTRSRSPPRHERRYRDDSRDMHEYHRRDRSREYTRRRSRDRDLRDRERHRDRRDDSRERERDKERERRRRDDSADSRRDRKRRDSRDKQPARPTERDKDRKDSGKSSPAVPAPSAEEAKKAERLARLEEWKKKQLAAALEKDKSGAVTPASTRGLLEEMDKKASVTASPSSPKSPASPKPYAGKFDPKAIVKKATTNSAAANKLGVDIEPPLGKAFASQKAPSSDTIANKAPAPGKAPSVSLKASGNLTGFGLSKSAESDKSQPKGATLDFGEEENSKRKLEKLPNPALENGDDDSALANGAQAEEEDDDDDVEMQDGTEEEAAAAARAAAERREERLHAQNVAHQEGDVAMQDTEIQRDERQDEEPEEEEDVDPLDAFMAGLGSRPSASTNQLKVKGKKVHEPVAIFGDEDETMEAVDDENTDDIMAMAATKRKKKDIPTVDHAKMDYEPFRKSFYLEPSELAEMTEEQLADLRLELEGIKVRGVDVPKPILSWAQCGLGVQTLDVISKLKYEKPSAIQSQAIPAIMSGRDVIGVAKTGSGKTVAFLLPMFRHIKDQRSLDNLEGPIALIMTPTRELATQIHRDCKPFIKALNLQAVCAYGGAPIKDQIAELKRGAEIVVCTPGRMIDLLAANAGRVTNLKRVTYCVLDEADRMFDMGFEPQVMKILANIRPDRQTVLFSATFPRQMEALARKTLTQPVEIIVGGRSVVAPEITQIIEVRSEESKFRRLLELLGELYEDEETSADYRALIFVERQESADSLLRDLMRKGYPCMSIHGGKDQIDRDSTIHDFKAGVVPILVATSVAARGLDVKQLKLVVNFDAPNHLEDYVHRAGRTGRAGNTGTAVTFITEDQDRYSLDLTKALTQSGQPVPESLQKLNDAFRDKVKAGKEKAAATGFGGRGLERLDQDRDAARNAQRKSYKTGDEPEEEEKEEGGKANKHDDLIAKAASTVQAAGSQPSKPLAGVPAGIDLDGKITVHKTEVPTAANGTGGKSSDDPMERVRQVVGRLNSKVGGGVSSGAPLDNKGPDAGAFHATLEINDFPQKARWAVTNRTNVAKILEQTGTSITTKGNFYATGKEPGPGEQPKLYILVEGDTELVVTTAMRELMRLLKDGTMAAAEGESRAPTGRYNVV